MQRISSVAKSKKKYYVVWRGRETGIFTSWDACLRSVNDFQGALFRGYSTWEEAHDAHLNGYWREVAKNKAVTPTTEVIRHSFATDAVHNADGTFSYFITDIEQSRTIYRSPSFHDSNLNVCRFLAIVHALAILTKTSDTRPVYSPSATAISWVSRRECRTSLCRTLGNTVTFDLIIRAGRFLADNLMSNPILRWESESWGEVPNISGSESRS